LFFSFIFFVTLSRSFLSILLSIGARAPSGTKFSVLILFSVAHFHFLNIGNKHLFATSTASTTASAFLIISSHGLFIYKIIAKKLRQQNKIRGEKGRGTPGANEFMILA
jgi:hypothetical protein